TPAAASWAGTAMLPSPTDRTTPMTSGSATTTGTARTSTRARPAFATIRSCVDDGGLAPVGDRGGGTEVALIRTEQWRFDVRPCTKWSHTRENAVLYPESLLAGPAAGRARHCRRPGAA